jgi:hypothetical protein
LGAHAKVKSAEKAVGGKNRTIAKNNALPNAFGTRDNKLVCFVFLDLKESLKKIRWDQTAGRQIPGITHTSGIELVEERPPFNSDPKVFLIEAYEVS